MATVSDTDRVSAPANRQAAIGLTLAALIVAAWAALHVYSMLVFELTWTNLPAALFMAAVQCWLFVGLFIIAHDAIHGSLAPGFGRLNGAIGGALLLLYAGFGWRRMRAAHFDHHKHSGKVGDPDFDENNPGHMGRWYTTFLKRYFGWRSALYVWLVTMAYWLLFEVPMVQIMLLYGLPAIASSLQLFYFGTFRPHRHEVSSGDGREAAFADRHNARSESFGTLASLASCYHFGYHHEHHLHPSTPWWALPLKRRETTDAKLAGPPAQ
ncbi:Beta-carotene ketolase [Alteripontixanthobacter maritimus]|uniref:Beta-carotene ketolase n=1 Tax=Alteripontixanthobacter maritimus TaxID=2161824 RepID=A0A369Q4K5_9SPHN|nr:fatty acid desaturase [Alteripontixanthobacter maritimus]RDC59422.1 Beta-carotene ketolase [Alteripontixanthobacter maritimus]